MSGGGGGGGDKSVCILILCVLYVIGFCLFVQCMHLEWLN